MDPIAKLVFDRYLVRQVIARTADKWQALPNGWTEESLEKFWESLTGRAKHKTTKCIEHMTGKIDDPGAFCSSARDRVEGPGWRSER